MNITNEDVTNYINGFYKPQAAHLAALRQEAESDGVPVILRETENFLAFLLKAFKPARILEIGTAVGYSAIFFAQLGAEVVTVEKSPDMADTARENIKEAGFESKITVLVGDGEEAIRQKLKESDVFDMVFIDAAKSHYRRFLDAALPFCRDGSFIVSDNVLLKGASASDKYDPNGRFKTNVRNMRRYLDYISDCPYLDTSVIACGDGLALSVYSRAAGVE